tara:strand:- start:43153 stop:43575 length:423 start_codon:yes stop_codon:yes gene_type:complete
MSDHIGAKLTYPALPEHATCMLGDKGYDSDEYRAALQAKGITPCIPPRKGRILPAGFDKTLYRPAASKNAAYIGLTEDRTRSLVQMDQKLLALRAATTEVLTIGLRNRGQTIDWSVRPVSIKSKNDLSLVPFSWDICPAD